MLYEMLSGERQFEKDQEQALIYAILNDKPTPLSLLRSDIPAQIETVIEKTLAKKLADRYQNVNDLIKDLKQAQPLIFPETEKSIIVLPFANLSPDPEQEYFCDGMTEEIISDLSNIQTLKVISRSSAMTFKGAKKKIRDIAREVNVQYVLEGSVRKAGNNLRITAQLIDAKNDVHLWAKKYSGTLDDVFDIQEKVSRSIVDALELKLSPIENKKITERPIGDIQAYDLFIRARKEILSGTEEGLERALQLINRGISIIGENELLLGVRGLAYFNYFNMGFKKEEEYLRKVQECADKIFALNSSSDMGHFLKAMIYWKKGNIRNAVREYKRSLKLNPNHVDSLMQLSYFYIISGKISAARPWLARLEEIAPLEWLAFFAAGEAELEQGNFEAGLEYLSRMIKIEPNFIWSRTCICEQA
jgi:TolB-like protein